jgi:hypothetical protein
MFVLISENTALSDYTLFAKLYCLRSAFFVIICDCAGQRYLKLLITKIELR